MNPRNAFAALVSLVAASLNAQTTYTPYTFTTLAGMGDVGRGSTDGAESAARFYGPCGIAVDGAGNVYVADTFNNTIRKITPYGAVTTLAGTAQADGSADGTGSAARFYDPTGIAVDRAGNVYVADSGNSTIRKITPDGVVTTLAGTPGVQSVGSADGTGSAAQFYYPYGVAVDGAGNVYVTDTANGTIRKISPSGVVTTLAGKAGAGGGGSADGTGGAARFNSPLGVAVDEAGTLYVADSNNDTIRKITPDGVVTTLAGTVGVVGNTDGTGNQAQFYFPSGISVDEVGNVYVADRGDYTIRKIAPGGTVTTLAGTAGVAGSANGMGSAAQFDFTQAFIGVAVDGTGNVYVADTGNDEIRKITSNGLVITLAGAAPAAIGSADGTGSEAQFDYPSSVAVDGAGNVYVADTGNNTIRKIMSGGVVTTLAGTAGVIGGSADGTGSAAQFGHPSGVAVDGAGNVYVADTYNNTIRKITPGGVVTTLAGATYNTIPKFGGDPSNTDGTGSEARFYWPSGIAVDGAGNVYVADTYNCTIRKITPGGVVTTFAGRAQAPGSADGTGSAALFNYPAGVAVDGNGNVYVADTRNNTVRKISPNGLVATLAGSAGVTGSADGTGRGAQFNIPSGLAVDGAGNVYVADFGNDTIRKITFGAVVTTLAGTPGAAGSTDGTGSGAQINGPAGVAVDATGNVYVADSGNGTIRKGTSVSLVIATQPHSLTVVAGAAATFSVGASGATTPTYQWYFNSQLIAGATNASYTIANAQPSNSGSYVAVASNSGGSTPSVPAMLTIAAGFGGPLILDQPGSQTLAVGSSVVFSVSTSGSSGTALTYEWFLNGNIVPGAASPILIVQATAAAAGNYTCLVINGSGSALSNAATLTVSSTTNPGRLINLSTNAVAGSGSQLLTVGFFVGGTGTTGSQTLLVQALGPALSNLGVTGAMPDPQLNAFSNQTVIGSNAGWGTPLSNQLAVTAADAATYATPLTNPASKDSAIVMPLTPGGYTVQVSSLSGVTGTTLATLYDDTPSGTYTPTTPRLINLSSRLNVPRNGSVTAGFWIGGTTAKTVLIRANGPALLAQGITGVMPDPFLWVYNSADNLVAVNGGWGGNPVLSSIAASVYAQPFTDPNSKDSEVLLTLPPGGYTAQVYSISNTAGNVMIEVYEVP
jgi:hypothetical protein